MRGSPLRALIPAVLALGLAAARPLAAQTILNVERLQPGDVHGWHWGVEGGAALSKGNTDKVDIGLGAVVGYRWSRDWLRTFGGINYLSEDGDKVDNDRYLHVRLNHALSDRWQTFHFVQVQSRYAALLHRRFLLGSGLRYRLLGGGTKLDAGTGVMFESESLDPEAEIGDHPRESRVWRMANLLVLTRPLTESVTLIGVAYLQPQFTDLADYRTLVHLALRISLTENLDLTIQNDWRHDSRPPDGVEPDDVSLRTGFAVSFE